MSEVGQLAVIVASVRKDRIGPMVARWFLSRVQANAGASVSTENPLAKASRSVVDQERSSRPVATE